MFQGNKIDTDEKNFIRYRCEQTNVTYIDEQLISNVQQKLQYRILLNRENRIARIKMEDFIHQSNPSMLNELFEFLSKTELIRNNIRFSFDENGKIEKVLNKEEQNQLWKELKNSSDIDSGFMKTLKKENHEIYQSVIESGDKQFSLNHPSEAEYRSNLFYSIFFNRYLTSDISQLREEEMLFCSTLFKEFAIPFKTTYDIQKEKDTLFVKMNRKINLENSSYKDFIIKQYDENYKPLIKYGFTDYICSYNMLFELNLNESLIDSGSLIIGEEVQYNIENRCEFVFRRLIENKK